MRRFIVATVLGSCSLVHAEFKDGNRLLSQLNSTGMEYMNALGYVTGVADTLYGVTHCAPANVTAGQITDMVRNYLENVPATRHHSADRHVHHVLKSAWPCPERGRRGSDL